MVGILLTACITAEACHGLPVAPPSLPEWATQRWIRDAAGIVAGETVPNCATCDLWIACTIVEDVTLRDYHPWRLRPGRWHGWRRPSERHLVAVEKALGAGGCSAAPTCAFLGSASDYLGIWRFGLAQGELCHVIGNRHGAIICVPNDDN